MTASPARSVSHRRAASVAAASAAEPQVLKLRWPLYRFKVGLDQSLLIALEDESRWAIRHALSHRNILPNDLDHLHLDALEAVFPAAVTVIH